MKTIKPFHYSGEIKINSSKSHVQRLLTIGLLARGKTTLKGYQSCEDNDACLSIINQLGAKISGKEVLEIESTSIVKQQEIKLFVNESGLCLRMYAFVASLFGKKIVLSASGSLLNRPLHFVQNALKNCGLEIENSNFPFTYHGEIQGGKINLDGSESSQMLTGLLITTPLLKTDTEITVKNLTSKPYIDLTIQLMKDFGVIISNNNYETFIIKGNQNYIGHEIEIEGDWSGAANHIIGAAISGKIKLLGLNKESNQADKYCLDLVKMFGASVIWNDGNLIIEKSSKPKSFITDLTNNPDLFPILSILACAAVGTSTFTGTNRLIHKESNRLVAVTEMLTVFGVPFTIIENQIEIHGKGWILGGEINTYNDHRIAMAATVAACFSRKEITISNSTCIGKSYPNFFTDLGL